MPRGCALNALGGMNYRSIRGALGSCLRRHDMKQSLAWRERTMHSGRSAVTNKQLQDISTAATHQHYVVQPRHAGAGPRRPNPDATKIKPNLGLKEANFAPVSTQLDCHPPLLRLLGGGVHLKPHHQLNKHTTQASKAHHPLSVPAPGFYAQLSRAQTRGKPRQKMITV